jgi:hypothetical protein
LTKLGYTDLLDSIDSPTDTTDVYRHTLHAYISEVIPYCIGAYYLECIYGKAFHIYVMTIIHRKAFLSNEFQKVMKLQVENLQGDKKLFKKKSVTRMDWKIYVISDEPNAGAQASAENRLFKLPLGRARFRRFLQASIFTVDRQTKQVLPQTRVDEDTLQVSMAFKQLDAEPFVGIKDVSLLQSFKRLIANKLWDTYKEFFTIWLQLLIRPAIFAKLIVNKKFEGAGTDQILLPLPGHLCLPL